MRLGLATVDISVGVGNPAISGRFRRLEQARRRGQVLFRFPALPPDENPSKD